jgi:hypothetical protein
MRFRATDLPALQGSQSNATSIATVTVTATAEAESLSTGAKVGIGIGVPALVLFAIGLVIAALFLARKRRAVPLGHELRQAEPKVPPARELGGSPIAELGHAHQVGYR